MNGDASVPTEPQAESGLAEAALVFARQVHTDQHRKQTYQQFVEHPIAVARLMSDAGFGGPLLAAAYLHDVVETTGVGVPEIRARFGPEVAAIVEALTDDPALEEYADRKRALRAQVLADGRGAVLIYAADRVANMRDWRTIPPGEREACAERLGTRLDERLLLWEEDLEELTAFDADLPFLAEIELDLRTLRAEAP